MVKGGEEICKQAIKKINEQQPDWKINIKVDNDRLKYMQQQQNQNQQHRNPQQINPYQQGNQQPLRTNFDQKQQPQNYYPQQGFTPNDPNQRQPYQPTSQEFLQPGTQPFYPQQNQGFQQHNLNEQPKIVVGDKPGKILVREIWLGGIPELCDKHYMHQLMSEFGIIENMEIFPKFAFIKYKMVEQASLAYERAERIYMMFGNPKGFKIEFSNHSRRANIVGNHYEYDRQSPFLPILYLGFPPVTSATIDLDLMKSICQKYGNIVNFYMKKSNNNNTRSQFMFTYDNIKSAIRAKGQLSRRKDLLGDKRTQVTLLLDQNFVLKNKDLTHTEKQFGTNTSLSKPSFTPSEQKQLGDKSQFDNSQFNRPQYDKPPQYERPSFEKQFQPRQYQNYPPGKQMPPMTNTGLNQPYPGMIYPNMPPSMHYPGYMIPPQGQLPRSYHPQDMYQAQNMYPPYNIGKQHERSSSTDVHELLQSVLEKTENSSIEKKPIKTSTNSDQNASDIVSKMLGNDREPQDHGYFKEREVTWSGFLTWKNLHRVEVDGFAQSKQLEDYVISITHMIDLKDMILKEKTTMILACGSPIHEPLFKEYLRALKGRAGVSSTPHSLMYILTKSKQSDEIQEIRDTELLVVMQRASLFSLIKDKLQKCEQLK